MKLISLKTTNFKKLGNSSFTFTDGLNVIVGDNGMGKSTLLRAIKAALFGPSSIPGKKENIPTWGQTTFGLELVFRVDEHDYVLTRSKSTAKLIAAGVDGEPELLANGNTPVTGYIENLLGLTAKDYDLFIQSAQGQTSGLLTFGGTALARKVEEFAGIETIDVVQSLANGRSREAEADSRALAVDDEDVKQAVADLEAATEEVTKQKSILMLMPKEFVEPEKPSPSARELERKVHTAKAWEQRRETAGRNLKDARERLDELLANPVGNPGEIADITDEISAAVKALKSLKATAKATEKTLYEFAQATERAEKLRNQIASEVSPAVDTAKLDALRNDLKDLEAEQAVLEGKRKQLQSLADDAQCPTCGTKLTDHDPEKLSAEIASLLKQVGQVAGEINTLRDQIKYMEKDLKDAEASEERVKQWTDELDILDLRKPEVDDLEGTQEEIDKLAESLAQLRNQESEHEAKLAAYTRYLKSVTRAETALKEAEQELGGLGDQPNCPTAEDLKAAEEAEAAWQKSVDELAAARASKAAAENALRMATKLQQTTEREVTKLRSRQEQAAEADRKADTAKRLSRFLGDRRGHYLQETWRTILAMATKQVNKATNGWITAIDYRDGDFYFVEDGIEVPATEASGAQAAFIGVALRIGLARALYGRNSLLILDEPTESMREDNAVNLVGSLAGTAQQILLITHREQDQSLANHVIAIGE